MKEQIPLRSELAQADTWDLSKLYRDDEAWEAGLLAYEAYIDKISTFKGSLGKSVEDLARWLNFITEMGLVAERLAYYSQLRLNEDEGRASYRNMIGRFTMAATRAASEAAWAKPEIQAIDDASMQEFLQSPLLKDSRIYLEKLLRFKPHILSESEERILSLHSEAEDTPDEVFSVLTNVDMDFGMVETADGPRPLSQSTWASFLEESDRDLRERAWKGYYHQFDTHKNTLASLYAGAVKQNIVKSRIRGFDSARERALFPDKVPLSVYDNLIQTVSANLKPLHRYYELRSEALGLDSLRHWDVYVPILKEGPTKRTSWNEAVDLIEKALQPLGSEYCSTLAAGLRGRWADRYENKGKRSGAFSAGSFVGEPYILMNYKEDSIRDLFTLAHEGGHSMHSWYSARSNPFLQYDYTIFEAEVASTFNEDLLFRYMYENEADSGLKKWILNKRIDDLLATLYRQTMFAEFEKRSHELYEAGKPLTLDSLRSEYRSLLEKYFGPAMVFEEQSDLEGLRIPHFYRAFYVYKYATGVSAAIALAKKVMEGGEKEREDYFSFLRSGGSRYPIEALRVAGVDMEGPQAVQAACDHFAELVNNLEKTL